MLMGTRIENEERACVPRDVQFTEPEPLLGKKIEFTP
jgi:hypothetical protein